MQISLYEVSGQTLRVGVRRGDDARPPLLIFNGIGANIELLEPFLDALDGYQTITFDVPGVGGSPAPTLPYRPGTLARLSARLLDQLGHQQVDMLGVSWGGALAQQFAFQHANRCRRLVLAATSPGHLMVPGKPTVLLKMASPLRYKDGDYMRRIAGDVYGGVLRRSPELVHRHLRHVRWSSDTGYYLQLMAVLGWSSLPWLRCLPQPTLVLAGTDDPLVPVVNGHVLASLIPDARLVTIDDGHLFLVTSASRSATLVSDFLSQNPAREGSVTMATYKAPLRDMRFVLYELHRGDALAQLPGFEEITPDLIDPVLEEAAKVCEEILFPLNRSGDEEGCVFENGVVRTPNGFQEAYRTFREGGWTSIACDPAYGGQGLPHSVAILIDEMICSSNLSFGLYPGLSYGAYVALHSYGSDALKTMYLPKLVEGVWSGTMCLTEPHCGTDLGLLRTRAVPQDDGSYRITGTKIFISAGDHDLTENIVHLVLARLPDAPRGIGGISLFLVPKFLVRDDGLLGARNGVACGSIEHKMGIKASATCVINFDDGTGWLIGEPHKGMRAMFTMMNTERLAVGIQGLGLAEASYQGAVAHARERLQGRALSGSKHPDKVADPIIVHPDVRRMLLTQRAYIEGCRALGGWVALALDEQYCNPDPDRRAAAEDLVALLTPAVKALFTDLGFEVTNLGLQVLGGHGYIREQGMEQYVRDCRITQIYEGTNGVQALDLVGRKLPADGGRLLRQFFEPIAGFIEERAGDLEFAPFAEPLAKAFDNLQRATAKIARDSKSDSEEAGAAASDYLRLFGLTALAYMWARAAEVALPKVKNGADRDGFYNAKLGTARFFMERLLPQTSGLFAAIMAGGRSMMEFDDAAL